MPKEKKTGTSKVKLSGFNYTPRRIRSVSNPGQLQNDRIRASNFDTIHKDNKIVFSLHTGRRWIRFLSNPLALTYLMQEKTAENTLEVIDGEAKVEGHDKFPYMINPGILGSAFFEKYRLFLNDNEIRIDNNTRNDQAFVQKMNRTFATKGDRMKAGVSPREWISTWNSNAYESGKGLVANPVGAIKPVHFNDFNYAEMSLDGWFPLSQGFNFAAEKLKTNRGLNDELFFPPDTKIEIELYLRPHHNALIENTNIHPKKYFGNVPAEDELNASGADVADDQDAPGSGGSGGAPAAGGGGGGGDSGLTVTKTTGSIQVNIDPSGTSPKQELTRANPGKNTISNIQFEIQDAELHYEYYVSDHKVKSKGIWFPIDLYRTVFRNVTSNSSSHKCHFDLPKNTVACYLPIIRDFQYDLNPYYKKSLSTFTVFPPDLAKVTFRVNGEIYGFDEGLKNLTGSKNWRCDSQKQYYKYLITRGLVSDEFEEFFHQNSQYESLQQAFFLDFSTINVNAGDVLTVELEFTGKLEDNVYKLLCISVFPGQIERSSETGRDGLKKWKLVAL